MRPEATSTNTDQTVTADAEPAFLDDDGPSAEIPPHVSTTNIRELYGWEPGESLDELLTQVNPC